MLSGIYIPYGEEGSYQQVLGLTGIDSVKNFIFQHGLKLFHISQIFD